jgi:hypothetical protein
MAKEINILSGLIQTIRESAFYNVNRLEELLFEDYPYPTSHEFIKALIEIHKGILQKIELTEKDIILDEKEFEDQAVVIQRYGQTLNSLHSLLQILEMGRREYVPQGIVVLIENIMKYTTSSKAKFLLLPNYEYNYAYVELIDPLKTALRDVLDNVEKSLAFADKFAIFWFPLAHKDNAILNALLAHEVGHFMSEEKQLVEKLISKVTIDQSKIQEIAQELLQTKLSAEKKEIKIDDFFGLETAKAQVKREVVVKVSDRLRELIADSIAFHLFGPAYLIALSNFLVTLADVDVEPKGYPSSRMRISFLIDEFEKAKYAEVLKRQEGAHERIRQKAAGRFGGIIENWREIVKKEATPSGDKISVLVHDAIHSVKDDLQKQVHDVVGRLGYTAERFELEVFKLIETIDSLVPPAEMDLEQPADPISILNAGMLYELALIEDMHELLNDQKMEERLLTRHKLHKLIMKAIESSQIQTIMKEMKEELPE